MTRITWKGKGPGTLYDKHERKRQDVEIAWRREANDGHDRIAELYADVQTDIGVLTALTLYEQLRFYAHELNSSLINAVLEVPMSNLSQTAEGYATQVWHIAIELERSADLKGKEQSDVVAGALNETKLLLDNGAFKSDVDDFETRLKWVDRIDFAGKLALILAASALTSGVAGSLAGPALETVGACARVVAAGELLAGSFAFTVTDRLGTQIAFGKTEGSFLGDWFWNAATFGVLKAADAGFASVFRLSSEAGRAARFGFKLGRTGTAMIAMEGLGELHSLIGQSRLLSGDELGGSLIQNAVFMTAMSAGHFITRPLEVRLAKGVAGKLGLDRAIARRLSWLEGERKSIDDLMKQMEPGKATSEDIGKLIGQTPKLWAAELDLVNRAEQSGIINKGDVDTSLAAYREHMAGIQLRLAQIGIDAPAPGGNVFTPVSPGVISFKPEGHAAHSEFFNAADPEMPGKSLAESATIPGALEGRLPNGQLVYFVPEATMTAEFSGVPLRTMQQRAALYDAVPPDLRTSIAIVEQIGSLRRLFSRLGTLLRITPGQGTQGFEARLEIPKLRAIQADLQARLAAIEARADRLSQQPSLAPSAAERDAITAEIESIQKQIDEHTANIGSYAPGRGFVAAYAARDARSSLDMLLRGAWAGGPRANVYQLYSRRPAPPMSAEARQRFGGEIGVSTGCSSFRRSIPGTSSRRHRLPPNRPWASGALAPPLSQKGDPGASAAI